MQGANRNRLKELRDQHGLKPVEVAALVDRDQSAIWRYESGLTLVPDDVKRKLCERYGVTVEFLMGWDRDPEPSNGSGQHDAEAPAA